MVGGEDDSHARHTAWAAISDSQTLHAHAHRALLPRAGDRLRRHRRHFFADYLLLSTLCGCALRIFSSQRRTLYAARERGTRMATNGDGSARTGLAAFGISIFRRLPVFPGFGGGGIYLLRTTTRWLQHYLRAYKRRDRFRVGGEHCLDNARRVQISAPYGVFIRLLVAPRTLRAPAFAASRTAPRSLLQPLSDLIRTLSISVETSWR